jgi:hypothetical protein
MRWGDEAIPILTLLVFLIWPGEVLSQKPLQPVKVAWDGGALTVVEPGTVLAIQKGEILGVPPSQGRLCPSKFQGGTLNPATDLCVAVRGANSRPA